MKDVIHLEIGEPDFFTPVHVLDAADVAARQGWTKYAPSLGDPELRAAVAEKVERENGIKADPKTEVIITCGGMSAIASAVMALVDDGDEVMLPDPGWANYLGHVLMAGGNPVYVPLKEEKGFALDPETVRAKITPKTKLIIVNSPSNPTGGITPPDSLAEVTRICAGAGVYVISDEVYEKLVFEGRHYSPASDPAVRDWVITVNSFSKTYSMTGWRVGYAVAAQPVIAGMMRLQEQMIACPSSVSQRAGLAALRGPQQCVTEMREQYRRRRDIVVEGFNRIPGFSCQKPPATFYAFPSIKSFGIPSMEFAMTLLEKTGVATVPGRAFGPSGEGYLRISFATSEKSIEEGLRRIEKAVSSGALESKR
ncbi:MAG: pyridoxal phosphate-dependent aminotransferase [Firmicutes bacterium]|nr:pyridoxal phosphate-dependent aminotransferase [Bacillota bacterium]